MQYLEETPLPTNLSPVRGFVSLRVKSRSVDKRFFAPTQDALLRSTAKNFSLSQEVMVGSRRICEANVTPRRAFVLKEEA